MIAPALLTEPQYEILWWIETHPHSAFTVEHHDTSEERYVIESEHETIRFRPETWASLQPFLCESKVPGRVYDLTDGGRAAVREKEEATRTWKSPSDGGAP